MYRRMVMHAVLTVLVLLVMTLDPWQRLFRYLIRLLTCYNIESAHVICHDWIQERRHWALKARPVSTRGTKEEKRQGEPEDGRSHHVTLD